MMNIYVFGNKDIEEDKAAFDVADKLKGNIKEVDFIEVKPNEDLPFVGEENVSILDAVQGIDEVTLIEESDLDKIILTKSISAHDYDLGFQLRYLKKLGKLKKFTIIGLPQKGKINLKYLIELINKMSHSELVSKS